MEHINDNLPGRPLVAVTKFCDFDVDYLKGMELPEAIEELEAEVEEGR